MEWTAFSRLNAHGIATSTPQGIAEILSGRTDHRYEAIIERPGKPAMRRLHATLEAAQQWVESQLSA